MNWDGSKDTRQISVSGEKGIVSMLIKVSGNNPDFSNIDWRYEVVKKGGGVYELRYKANNNNNDHMPITSLSVIMKSDRNTSNSNIEVTGVTYYQP